MTLLGVIDDGVLRELRRHRDRTGPRSRDARASKPRIRQRLRCERGFTLVELLVAMPLSLVIVSIPLFLLIAGINGQNVAASRSVAARQAETGLEQLTRDLRQAVTATISSTASGTLATAQLTLPVRTATPSLTALPATQQVNWSCAAGGTCTRQAGGGAFEQLITGVTSACFDTSVANNCATAVPSTTNPAFVYLTIQARVTSQLPNGSTSAVHGVSNPVTLKDGIDLRNYS